MIAGEEAIEVANNNIRDAKERRPAAAAELALRSTELEAAQAALDDLLPKRKAPAEAPQQAAQCSGGSSALDPASNLKALVGSMREDPELLSICWGEENSTGRMALNGVFNHLVRHAEMLSAKKSGQAAPPDAMQTFELPQIKGQQEMADEIIANMDIAAMVEASLEGEAVITKKAPPDKAKMTTAAKKNLAGQVKNNYAKLKQTAKPADKGADEKFF